jgi:hypothetical protein
MGLRPLKLAGDKAYSSPTARRRLRRRGITPVIPTKSNQRRNPRFDHAMVIIGMIRISL